MPNPSHNGPITLSLPKSAGLDDVQLCFNKAHFNREDFDVERFVNLARRRATLDQIHNDLRTYLRYLQNSMIELINDDYADFVNLSSTLATLKDSIVKISSNVGNSWQSFSTSTAEVQTVAEIVRQKCSDLLSNRKEQILARNKIAFLTSVNRLSKCLQQRPSAISVWFSKLLGLVLDVELWYRRIPQEHLPVKGVLSREKCYSNLKNMLIEELVGDLKSNCSFLGIILPLLTLIGQYDSSVLAVSNSVVDKEISLEHDIPKDVILAGLFEQILAIRGKWRGLLKKNSHWRKDTETFVDTCLLSYCLTFLEQKFGSVLVPSDNRLFHRCYSLTIDFIRNWPSKCCRHTLKAIKNKFNTIVYFKMETQHVLSEIKSQSKPEKFTYLLQEKSSGNICPLSNTIILGIEVLFSEQTFLPPLIDKFWDFSLKCLSNYLEWISNINTHFVKELSNEEAQQSVEPYLALAALAWDIASFNNRLNALCANHIWRLITTVKGDLSPFEECINAYGEEINFKQTELFESISALLLKKTTKELSTVNDIPRQYRWTRKPTPSCFSPYLEAAFSVCEKFSAEATEICWNEIQINLVLKKVVEQSSTIFCEKAGQVLDSVEQTGSSLQRFKKKAAVEGQSDQVADSDEAKIRKQLVYDTNFVIQRATEHDINLDSLRTVLERAQAEAQ
ncbi:conserved oligomeric golgi complex component, COG2 domain-containing protein [Ditylenchus destructor]|uniref:Conserved oligomeric Golgi complex subunit 2 n=1 Tax=Ditylenchus destructor TaxID=166010 RepID=A0AAD4RCM3_9BILA|nr:conserved oligomeric golgi complex component, COG2 domain-containing protein [Ditylenchus destructor]